MWKDLTNCALWNASEVKRRRTVLSWSGNVNLDPCSSRPELSPVARLGSAVNSYSGRAEEPAIFAKVEGHSFIRAVFSNWNGGRAVNYCDLDYG